MLNDPFPRRLMLLALAGLSLILFSDSNRSLLKNIAALEKLNDELNSIKPSGHSLKNESHKNSDLTSFMAEMESDVDKLRLTSRLIGLNPLSPASSDKKMFELHFRDLSPQEFLQFLKYLTNLDNKLYIDQLTFENSERIPDHFNLFLRLSLE